MILRLVYSFFFLNLVTGNQQLEGTQDAQNAARAGSCKKQICVYQDQLEVHPVPQHQVEVHPVPQDQPEIHPVPQDQPEIHPVPQDQQPYASPIILTHHQESQVFTSPQAQPILTHHLEPPIFRSPEVRLHLTHHQDPALFRSPQAQPILTHHQELPVFKSPQAQAILTRHQEPSVFNLTQAQPILTHYKEPSVYNSPQAQPILTQQQEPPVFESPQAQPILTDHQEPPVFKSPQAQAILNRHQGPPVFTSPQAQPILTHHEKPPVFESPQFQPILTHHQEPPIFKSPQAQPILTHHEKPPVFESPQFQPILTHHQEPPVFKSPQSQPILTHHHEPPVFKSPQAQPISTHHQEPPVFKSPQAKPILTHHHEPPVFKSPQAQPILTHHQEPQVFKSPQAQTILTRHQEPSVFNSTQAKPIMAHHQEPSIYNSPQAQPILPHHQERPVFKLPQAQTILTQNQEPPVFRSPQAQPNLTHYQVFSSPQLQPLPPSPPPMTVHKAHYGFPPEGLISPGPGYVSSSPTAQIKTKKYDVEFVSDNENPNNLNEVPRQYISEEDTQYSTEKTTCFTPRMVHKMVKAALEYVSHMPSSINNIIDKIDQELNRMSDAETVDVDEHVLKKPLYPLDSKNVFQTLDQPHSESRTNVILHYELPSVQKPQCRDALEKFIKIAYNAYKELEQHPQCKDYLYRFASQQPEDRPKGHLEYEPDLKSLIASILDSIVQYNPRPIQNRPEDLNSNPTNIIDMTNPEKPVRQIYDILITQTPAFKIPQINELNILQFPEFNTPQIPEFNNPQTKEITGPQIQELKIPKMYETIRETIKEIISMPMQPEKTVNILINLLNNNDQSSNLFDHLMDAVEENQNNFHPQIFKILLNLLTARKQQEIPKFNEIFLLLLNSQRNKQWPWSDTMTEDILSFLLPDQTGRVDSRIVDIILNLHRKQTNVENIEYILSLLRPIKEGYLDSRITDIIINLINSHQNNLLRPEQIEILLKLLKPSSNGLPNTKETDIINDLSRWNEMGISPKQIDAILTILKPDLNGRTDRKTVDIIHSLLKQKRLSPKDLNFILSFLYPVNGIIDTRRIDIIHFILNYALPHSNVLHILLSLLQENTPGVLNSRFLEVLLYLGSNRLLTIELLETVISLMSGEITGGLDVNQLESFFFQLGPYKQANPKIAVDILNLLSQGGPHENIVEWVETINRNVGMSNRDNSPDNLNVVVEEFGNMQPRHHIPSDHGHHQPHDNEYRTSDGGYQTTEDDFKTIFKWLNSQGLLNTDQGAPNNELLDKLSNDPEMGKRESGVVELTYMLKHEKPVIYQPVYYVKYRLPVLSFISNMKTMLLEHPHLTADPAKLLQELIVISNVTEVSPNLQGYPKEEIMKLTLDDGDLVQAKILDEHNLNLNEQIAYVHGLNSDISPEELLQLNRMNEEQYPTSNVVQFRTTVPEQHVTVQEIDKLVEYPPAHYQYVKTQGLPHHTIHTIKTHIERTNQRQIPQYIQNAQLLRTEN